MSWLVFDCPSGISGDMTLGALVDLGVPLEVVRDALATLPLEGYSLRVERVHRSTIQATRVHVDIEDAPPGGGTTFEGRGAPARGEQPPPAQRQHRHLHDVVQILAAGKLTDRALAWSVDVFRRLATAEAAVHGASVEQVHFHEVGAVDAIVDIAGACIGLDWLCRTQVVRAIRVSQLRVGRGKVRTEHGIMPVPPPATLRLLESFPIQWSEVDGERVTPTGAAILATLARPLGGVAVRVRATGYGAGALEFADAPNVLRLLRCDPEGVEIQDELPEGMPLHQVMALVEEARREHAHGGHSAAPAQPEQGIRPAREREPAAPRPISHAAEHAGPHVEDRATEAPAVAPESHPGAAVELQRGQVAVITTTIDDMVPEFYGHLMSKLFASGALDVVYTPIFMKKERPATQVTVIARPQDAERLAQVVLTESSTLGVRIAHEERLELERHLTSVHTRYGDIQVKVAVRPDGKRRAVPEYESVRRAAEAAGVPIADVYQAALSATLDPQS